MPVRSFVDSLKMISSLKSLKAVAVILSGLSALSVSASAHADAKGALPASVDTFKMTKPVQVFTPGTLESHIDGQAESVKKYDFKQCDYAEYAPGGTGNQLITVDIYEMGSPLDSYGYYSYQLYPSAKNVKFVKIGGIEGYQTKDGINFWKGAYYVNVTITAANSPANYQAELPKIAAALIAKLSGGQPAAPMLALLPPGRTLHSEHFQRMDIFSQVFLKNGVIANYPSAGPKTELFVAQYPSVDAAKQAYTLYAAYLNKPSTAAMGAKPTAPTGLGDTAVAVRTKFGGQVVATIKGKYLVGVRNAVDPAGAQALVKAAIAKSK